MNHLKSLLALAMFSFFIVSCTLDSETVDASLDLTAQINTSAKDQVPNEKFDATSEGIYHGIFTSGKINSRGKIWVNIGNNDRYNAVVELVGAGTYTFELATNVIQATNTHKLKFVNPNGSFVINVTDPDSAIVTDASLNNLVHLSRIYKNTSNRAVTVHNGFFTQTVGTLGLSGSWDLVADGTLPNPNGIDPPGPTVSEGITDVLISYDPDDMGPLPAIMKTDTSFELFPECFLGTIIPQTGGTGGAFDIFAGNQTSDFGGRGMTDWHVNYNTFFGPPAYFDTACNAFAGSGSWTRDAGANQGIIVIDLTP